MKKVALASIVALIIVFSICSTSVLALTIDKDWTFFEDFEGRNDVSYKTGTINSVNYIRKYDEANGYPSGGSGAFMIARQTLVTFKRVKDYNYTPDADPGEGEGRSLFVMNESVGSTTVITYIANTYFYGNPSQQPSGSGVFCYGYDGTTDSSYYYNGAKYYEQTIHVLWPSSTERGHTGFGTDYTHFQWNIQQFEPDNPDAGDSEANPIMATIEPSGEIRGKGIALETDRWYEFKFAANFMKSELYCYLDGELITTWRPTTEGKRIHSVRRMYMHMPPNGELYLDDISMNPFGGEGLPSEPFDTVYYIDDEEASKMADGVLTASVDLSQVPDEEEYKIIGVLFAKDMTVKSISIINSSDIFEAEHTIEFGDAVSTDRAKVMVWGTGGKSASPVTEVKTLK